MDELVDTYETRVGLRNGAQVVARAWVDPEFKRRLLEDATATSGEHFEEQCASTSKHWAATC